MVKSIVPSAATLKVWATSPSRGAKADPPTDTGVEVAATTGRQRPRRSGATVEMPVRRRGDFTAGSARRRPGARAGGGTRPVRRGQSAASLSVGVLTSTRPTLHLPSHLSESSTRARPSPRRWWAGSTARRCRNPWFGVAAGDGVGGEMGVTGACEPGPVPRGGAAHVGDGRGSSPQCSPNAATSTLDATSWWWGFRRWVATCGRRSARGRARAAPGVVVLEEHQLLHEGEAGGLDPERGRRAQRPGAHPRDNRGRPARRSIGRGRRRWAGASVCREHQVGRVGAERPGAHPAAHTVAGENERGGARRPREASPSAAGRDGAVPFGLVHHRPER